MTTPECRETQRVLEDTAASVHAECFCCGRRHPRGFRLRFHACEDGSIEATCPCEGSHQGYAETLHGGLVSAYLDSAMTNCLFAMGVVAVTAELKIRFMHPVRTGRHAVVRARVERVRGRLCYLRAELSQDRVPLARAEGTFVRRERVGAGVPRATDPERTAGA